MAASVVDTNVAVIANGGDNVTASPDCQTAAVKTLQKIVESGCVAIDSLGEIMTEYSKRLSPTGQPGVGDLFLRHVIDHQGNVKRVQLQDVSHKRGDRLRAAIAAGSLNKFDNDDRVFAFCALAAKAQVLTATDSDWAIHEAGLTACGVRIKFVCGRAAATEQS